MVAVLLVLALSPQDDVGKLLVELRKANPATRVSIEIRLGNAAEDRHIPVFLRELARGPGDIRISFVRVLRTHGTKKSLAALRSLQSLHHWAFRGEVWYARKILGDLEGMDYLVTNFASPRLKLKDRLAIVHYLSASYCGKSGKAAKSLRIVLGSDKDTDLRKRILTALVTHKDPDSLSVLRAIMEDPADAVRFEAMAAMISTGDQSAMEAALAVIEEGSVPVQACFALFQAIQKRGSKSILPRLRSALEKSGDLNIRMRIIETLSKMGDRKALKIFQELAGGENVALARAALDGILALAGWSNVPGLVKLLGNKDAQTRIRVAKALLALDDTSGLPVLRGELSSDNATIRREAVMALGTCRRGEVVDLLLIAMEDPDASIRTTAASFLRATLEALHPYRRFNLGRMGYRAASADEASRKAALEKIRAWWRENRSN